MRSPNPQPSLNAAVVSGFLADTLGDYDVEPSGYCKNLPVWEFPRKASSKESPSLPLRMSNDFIEYDELSNPVVYCMRVQDLVSVSSVLKPLTNAEQRLCLLLCTGLDLRECAAASNRSYETARSHVKSIYSKTEFSGQSELIAATVSEVVAFFQTYVQAETQLFQRWREYTKYLPETIRLGVLVGSEGVSVRYLEFGDPKSEPLYVLHSLIFPSFDAADVAFAEQIDRRIIVPVRRGALGDESPKLRKWTDYVQTSADDLSLAIKTFSGKNDKIDLVALVSGGAIATKYALDNPDQMNSVSFLATCYSAGKPTGDLRYFGANIVELLGHNRKAGHAVFRFIRNATNKTRRFKEGMRAVYSGSPSDMRLIEEDVSDPIRRDRLMLATIGSFYSAMFDYLSQFHFDWRDVKKIECDTKFVHGNEDGVHSVASLCSMSERILGKSPIIVEGVGHFTQGSTLRALLAACLKTETKYPLGPSE